METLVLPITKDSLRQAAKIINDGGLVAFKTETVYGLGASIYNEDALRQIFLVKGRPQDNPLIVHLHDKEDIETVAKVTPLAKLIIDNFMPGAVTLVLNKKPCVSSVVSAGLETVAVRVPMDESAAAFLRECKVPIAAPSANTSTRPSPTKAIHVYEDLKGKIPLILDGGECAYGLESTVLDARGENLEILRLGAVSVEDIEKKLGVRVISAKNTSKPRSPGMKYRHYAPKKPFYFAEHSDNGKIIEFLQKTDASQAVIFCTDDMKQNYINYNIMSLGKDATDAAHRLFSLMREAEKKYSVILALGLKDEGLGKSVNNRMRKAAADNIL